MNNKKLIKECYSVVNNFYKGGRGLKSTELKNYTSGDHKYLGFENLVEKIIWKVIDDIGINRKRVEVHNNYFQSDYSVNWTKDPKDPQRMDFHIKIDGKHPLIIESRAWIDKPFYQMKRCVTKNFMELSYVKSQLTNDVKCLYIALCADVKDRTIKAMNKTMKHGSRVKMIGLSPYRRGYKGGNYFDHGCAKQQVKELVKFMHEHLSKYKTTQEKK